MNDTILVTGATGFIGQALCRALQAEGRPVRAVVRRAIAQAPDAAIVGEIGPDTHWTAALQGVHCIVHCAARVHVMRDHASDPLDAFRQVNVLGTLNLARQAAAADVRRFVFISSIKVNGEATLHGRPFTAADVPAPQDAYGLSKHEAELGLREIAARTGMEVVIVRPPLVYGPGVRANFAALIKWLKRGVPLPLGAIRDNRRSLVALDNLVHLLIICTRHPRAANQTFLVSDGEDLSTADLLVRLGQALRRPAHLLPVPVSWLQIGARLVGRPEVAQRLVDNLQVDIGKTRELLDWSPRVSVDEGLHRTLFPANDGGLE